MAKRKFYDFNFAELEQPLGIGTLGTAIADTDGLSTLWSFGPGYPNIEQFNIAANTLLGPIMTTTGVEWSGDEADNDGIDLSLGVLGKAGPYAHTVGTDPAFFVEASFNFKAADDDEDFDVCAVGFRRAGIAQFKLQAEANFTSGTSSFTDYACLNSDQGEVHILTELNSAGLSATDTTDVVDHSAVVTFRVNVSAAGVVTYLIDGAAPTTTAAFTFDDGDIVVPFIAFVHDASDGTIELRTWRGGYQ